MGCFGLDPDPKQKSPPESSPISQYSSFTLYQKFGDSSNEVQYLTNDRKSMSWSKNPPKFFNHNRVLASCNRFLLCTKTYSHSVYPHHVYNLVTNQWFPVPSPRYSFRDDKFSLWGIVCCRDQSSRCAEGGVTQITQFKVVKIVRDSKLFRSDVLEMEIFDSATNKWDRYIRKQIDRILTFSKDTGNALEHGGILYWRGKIEDDEVLFAFDINLDMCVLIRLPGMTGLHNVLGVSQNHLYYVTVDFVHSRAIIWRYDEFEGEKTWRSRHKFVLDWIDRRIYKDLFSYFACVLAIDPVDCNVLIVSALDVHTHYIRRVYSLNLRKKTMREISSSPIQTNKPICRVLPYIDCEP